MKWNHPVLAGLLTTMLGIVVASPAAFGWHDETHLAVAKAAGYSKWYNTTGPDMTKIKAKEVEKYNHRSANPLSMEVTPAMVQEQIRRYDDPHHTTGHLYGAIVASLRTYMRQSRTGKYPQYHLAFCAHYIADLSQPLHNVPYDEFNLSRHSINDGTVEKDVLNNLERIRKHMYALELRSDHFEEDLIRQIVRIANEARSLAQKLIKDTRNMTEEEAYIQLGHSASLLRAVLNHLEEDSTRSHE